MYLYVHKIDVITIAPNTSDLLENIMCLQFSSTRGPVTHIAPEICIFVISCYDHIFTSGVCNKHPTAFLLLLHIEMTTIQ